MTQYRTAALEELLRHAPKDAKALIVAELNEDRSDLMSDYHGHTTTRRVAIGWRTGSREDFRQLRKAAARWNETEHLGPGRDLHTLRVVCRDDIRDYYRTLWKGSYSPWHSDIDGHGYGENAKRFATREEADFFMQTNPAPRKITVDGVEHAFDWQVQTERFEHRENYSMGAGNYLKHGDRDSNGWRVVSRSFEWSKSDVYEIAPCLFGGAQSERPRLSIVT